MFNADFSLGKLVAQALRNYPSFKFRDRDRLVHNASDAAKCHRQVTYKGLGYEESNPADLLGTLRMSFGQWLEAGLKYAGFAKLAPFGAVLLSAQGDAGEHGSFYGTSWHGYRDFDMGIWYNGKLKPFVVELKTKVGYGAQVTLKKSPWSREYIIPEPDQAWGYSQQISLYLRDAYLKTKDNPKFSSPITDGIIFQLLYADGLATFIEYYFKYDPEEDTATCYKVHCEDYPESSGPLDIKIKLKDIADRFSYQDKYLSKGELAPPEFERKYSLDDPRVLESTKTDLEKASKGLVLLGDMQCKYCSFRDKCSADLGIELSYTPDETKKIKNILRSK